MEIEKISLTELRNSATEILEEVEQDGKAFIVNLRGKACAVLISTEDFEILKDAK